MRTLTLIMLAVAMLAVCLPAQSPPPQYMQVCLAPGKNCQWVTKVPAVMLPPPYVPPPNPWTCAANATGGYDCTLNGKLSAVTIQPSGTGAGTIACTTKGYVLKLANGVLQCVPGGTP